jgi:hypothetical protein
LLRKFARRKDFVWSFFGEPLGRTFTSMIERYESVQDAEKQLSTLKDQLAKLEVECEGLKQISAQQKTTFLIPASGDTLDGIISHLTAGFGHVHNEGIVRVTASTER